MAKLLKLLPFLMLVLLSCGQPIKRIGSSVKNKPEVTPTKTQEALKCTPELKIQHLELIEDFNSLTNNIKAQNDSFESMTSKKEVNNYKEKLALTTGSVLELEKSCNQLLGTIKILEEKKTYFKTERVKDNLICSYNHNNQTSLVIQRSTKTLEDKGIAQYCNFNYFVNTINKINDEVRSKYNVKNIVHINLDPDKIVREQLLCTKYSELVEGIDLQRKRVDVVNSRLIQLKQELGRARQENIETLAQEFENKYFYLYNNEEKKYTDLYQSLKNNCTLLKSYQYFDYDKCKNDSNLRENALASKQNCNISSIETTRKMLLPTYNAHKKAVTVIRPEKPMPKPKPTPAPPKKTPAEIEKDLCNTKFTHGYQAISSNYLMLKKDIDLVEIYKKHYASKKKTTFMLDILQTFKNSLNKNLNSYIQSCSKLKASNPHCLDKKLVDVKKYNQYCQVQAYSNYSSKTLENSINQITSRLFKRKTEFVQLRPILENLKNEILFDSNNSKAKSEYSKQVSKFAPSFTEFLEICSSPYFLKLDAQTLNISRLSEAQATCKEYTTDQELNDISLRDFK